MHVPGLLAALAHVCIEGRKCYAQTTDFQYAILCAPFVGARCGWQQSLDPDRAVRPCMHACQLGLAAADILVCLCQAGDIGVHPNCRTGGLPRFCVCIHALQRHGPVAAVRSAHVQGAGIKAEVCQYMQLQHS